MVFSFEMVGWFGGFLLLRIIGQRSSERVLGNCDPCGWGDVRVGRKMHLEDVRLDMIIVIGNAVKKIYFYLIITRKWMTHASAVCDWWIDSETSSKSLVFGQWRSSAHFDVFQWILVTVAVDVL